ncbi:DHS-like NAD/FAD-binding domain-containing protein [Lophiostoma macrostomum CBS 122681]|uniref:DHS-like NAD/FAD-binding domain-containing protein n=1 Tax=Lophiostoma macrostomum CBS 122681 TaxID=1314788 RepID=A0A6A6TC62_9PLEO|nr:DHS-like NAD/FAD-binding domain-containing protein [Lophiostoma macrostomum CBS 122681]
MSVAFDRLFDGSSSPLSSVPDSVDSDSELSSVPDSLPSSPILPHDYPSPLSSQRSSAKTSPAPDNMTRTPPSSDNDAGPPRKKRKLNDPKQRTTERLDLTAADYKSNPQLQRVMDVLHKKRKIVVIAGAGISVSAGIPDFRSSGGLFSSLRKQHKLKSSGKDLFDASVYQDDSSTSSFHDMVRSLSQKTKDAHPTPFHHLLATLAEEGRLLRLYSQNVDGIDTSLEPLKTEVPLPKKGPWPKTVQLHGGLDHMVCSKCHTLSPFDAEQFNGPTPPACRQCTENDQVRQVAEKRSHGIGRMRPRMVLYNEHNPDDEAIGSCTSLDLRTRPDAVIVAGTTLKVPGVRRIAREMCAVVRDRRDGVTIWINNDPEPLGKDLANSWDIVVKGPCDAIAHEAAMPRWDDPILFNEVTDEILSQAKEKQKPMVMVPTSTPKKSAAFEQVQGQMLTPAQSPRMKPQTAVNRDSPTPSKGNARKRKSEAQNTIKKEVKPPAKRQPKKAAGAKKSKAKPNKPITDNFKVTKATKVTNTTLKSASSKLNPVADAYFDETSDTIKVAQPATPIRGGRLTKYKEEYLSKISPFDSRNNPNLTPQRPPMEPFTSPVKSPPPQMIAPSASQNIMPTLESRPSSSDSNRSRMAISNLID